MLCFQVLLLGGYAYAHLVSTTLKPQQQTLLHLGILVSSVVLLGVVSIVPAIADHPRGQF